MQIVTDTGMDLHLPPDQSERNSNDQEMTCLR